MWLAASETAQRQLDVQASWFVSTQVLVMISCAEQMMTMLHFEVEEKIVVDQDHGSIPAPLEWASPQCGGYTRAGYVVFDYESSVLLFFCFRKTRLQCGILTAGSDFRLQCFYKLT